MEANIAQWAPVLGRELELGDLAEEAPRAIPQVRADAGHTREGDRRRRRRHGKLTRFPSLKKLDLSRGLTTLCRAGRGDGSARTICDWAVYTQSFFNAGVRAQNNAMLAGCNTLGSQEQAKLNC